MKEYQKNFEESPPAELLNAIEQVQSFQTSRLTKELWKAGENLLRKEKLWANNPFNSRRSELSYCFQEEIYTIDYERKVGFGCDNFTFCLNQVTEKDETQKNIFILRYKNNFWNFFKKETLTILITENGSEKSNNVFYY